MCIASFNSGFPSFSKHQFSMAVQILDFHRWFENRDVGGVWHPRARSRDSAEDRRPRNTPTPGVRESKTSKEYGGRIEECKVGAGDWLVQTFEMNQNSASVSYQRVIQNHLRQTKVMRKSSIMDSSLIELISLISCTKQLHETQHSHGLMDQANHGNVVGKIIGGCIPKTRTIEQSITIHGSNFEQERWTQLTHY